METVFDSERLPATERVEAWHHALSRALAPDCVTVNRSVCFQASLRTAALGAAQVSAIAYSSLRARRTPLMIRRSDPEVYCLALVLRGRQTIQQARRQTTPDPRELVMYSSSEAYDVNVDAGEGTASCIEARLPRSLVPLALDKVGRLLTTRLPARDGTGALLAHFLTHLATDTGSRRPAETARLGTVLLDLMTAYLAHHLDCDDRVPPESRRRADMLRIRAFIHRHLHDPGLAAEDIAAAHHISTRQLHRLFHGQGQGETVAAFIRHQRLEGARRELTDPSLAHKPIHAIAARWGLPDPARFSRAFRAAYGIPPSAYRRDAQGAH